VDAHQGRQLTRSETDKRIAGVCGGIAEYFDIDPTIVRILFVAAALLGGPGVIAYIVLWIVLPKGLPRPAEAPRPGSSRAWLAGSNPAVRIAEERFARGEINAEELHRIRTDLTGAP
jgi:phage shock protein C